MINFSLKKLQRYALSIDPAMICLGAEFMGLKCLAPKALNRKVQNSEKYRCFPSGYLKKSAKKYQGSFRNQ